jgi:hypothetical protein
MNTKWMRGWALAAALAALGSRAAALTMLVYGPTSGGLADATPGFTVTVWSAATWATKTTAQFAAFDVIVFGDHAASGPCFPSASTWSTAITTAAVWGPAVSGNKVVIGSDPDYHNRAAVVQQLVQFAASDPSPGPGLYVALSCVYESTVAPAPVDLLGYFGAFTASQGVGDAAHIVAASPALTGITDALLSNWNSSVHEGFNSWPASWQPLAIVTDAASAPYHAGDGTDGLPYILAQGSSVVAITSGTPTPSFTETPSATISPTFSYSPTATPTRTVTPTPSITPTFTATPPPLQLHLYPPNPNPSGGGGSWLPFWLSVPAMVDITIYTVAGEEVTRLAPQYQNGGVHEEFWDNKNRAGKPVASGVFIYKLVARSARDEILSDAGKCSVLR